MFWLTLFGFDCGLDVDDLDLLCPDEVDPEELELDPDICDELY